MRTLWHHLILMFVTFLIAFMNEQCVPLKTSYQENAFYPYYFEKIQIELIEYHVTVKGTAATRSIPAHPIEQKVIDSLIYRAELLLRFYPADLVWTKSIPLVVETANNRRMIDLNSGQYPLSNSEPRRFTVFFKTPAKEPWVQLSLGVWKLLPQDSTRLIIDTNNIFKSRRIKLPDKLAAQISL